MEGRWGTDGGQMERTDVRQMEDRCKTDGGQMAKTEDKWRIDGRDG